MHIIYKVLFFLLPILHTCNSLAGENTFVNHQDAYSPVISFTAKNSKHRNISEFNFMLPMIQAENSLFLSDIKIKADDRKNAEYNLGLAYRRNISDQYIIGMYSYFDRKTTFNDLLINQWAAGAEVLSNYLDVRANIYVPENKKKVISPASVELVRDGTRIYGLKKNAQEECALPGYDIELGFPVFGGGSWLNEKLETKFYVTRYYFKKQNFAKNIGTQLRIEQPVFNNYFNPQNLELKLSIGSNFTNKKKMDNFLGLSFRMALGENSSNFSKVGLKKRMLDTIIRDVDIVTSYQQFNSVPTPVFLGDQLIDNVYFVGDTNNREYSGDGSYEKPFSKAQLLKLKKDKRFVEQSSDLILPIQLDKELNSEECCSLIKECTIGCSVEDPHYLKTEAVEFSLEECFPELEKIKLQQKAFSDKANLEKKSPLVQVDNLVLTHVSVVKGGKQVENSKLVRISPLKEKIKLTEGKKLVLEHRLAEEKVEDSGLAEKVTLEVEPSPKTSSLQKAFAGRSHQSKVNLLAKLKKSNSKDAESECIEIDLNQTSEVSSLQKSFTGISYQNKMNLLAKLEKSDHKETEYESVEPGNINKTSGFSSLQKAFTGISYQNKMNSLGGLGKNPSRNRNSVKKANVNLTRRSRASYNSFETLKPVSPIVEQPHSPTLISVF